MFVALGVPDADRDAYFTWVEGKGPDFVVEFTSRATRGEDLRTKFAIYQDILRVREYFLFDLKREYLEPSMRGYRLVDGRYRPIEPVDDRLPSEVTGLHLERDGVWLRLHNPATGLLVPTKDEELDQAEADLRRARDQADAEIARLRAQIEELKRQRG